MKAIPICTQSKATYEGRLAQVYDNHIVYCTNVLKIWPEAMAYQRMVSTQLHYAVSG